MNMKLKSTLWALAFACAAVSCSDDLDESGKGNGTEGSGEKGYVKIAINNGVETKADSDPAVPPTAGEDGDTPNGEEGTANEYKINNVTLILFKNTSATTGNEYKLVKTSTIVGAGYATAGAETNGDDDWHKHGVMVEVSVTQQGESFDGNTYGVITVANMGETLYNLVTKQGTTNPQITTGEVLANYLVDKAHTSNENFIMSSHKEEGEKVTLHANESAAEERTTALHVERLAAKVRLNPITTPTQDGYDFFYTHKVGTDGNTELGKARLDHVALINNLSSGSYLLKRVTGGDQDDELGDDDTNDIYLGDEEGSANAAENYVVDPWTRGKKTTGAGDAIALLELDQIQAAGVTQPIGSATKTLTYTNYFQGGITYDILWGGRAADQATSTGAVTALQNTIALAQSSETTIPSQITLGYPMENIADQTLSKKGYVTGALFKAVYFPKVWVNNAGTVGQTVVYDAGGDSGNGYADLDKDSDGTTFCVYQGNVYESEQAIFNQVMTTEQVNNITYETFKAEAKTILYSNIKGALNVADPFGYIAYLNKKIDEYNAVDGQQVEENTTLETLGASNLPDYLKSAEGAAIFNKLVSVFEDGVCYYPYWIKHANNNDVSSVGIMEFAIVRNNIYDLTVTKVGRWGLPGSEVTDPPVDPESPTFYFNVNVNVLNWKERKNDNIVL